MFKKCIFALTAISQLLQASEGGLPRPDIRAFRTAHIDPARLNAPLVEPEVISTTPPHQGTLQRRTPPAPVRRTNAFHEDFPQRRPADYRPGFDASPLRESPESPVRQPRRLGRRESMINRTGLIRDMQRRLAESEIGEDVTDTENQTLSTFLPDGRVEYQSMIYKPAVGNMLSEAGGSGSASTR